MEYTGSVGAKHLVPSLILCGRGCSLRWPALFRLDACHVKISQLKACILLALTLNYLKGSVASALFQKGKHGSAKPKQPRLVVDALRRQTQEQRRINVHTKNRVAVIQCLPSLKIQGQASCHASRSKIQNWCHHGKVSLACSTYALYIATKLTSRDAIASS